MNEKLEKNCVVCNKVFIYNSKKGGSRKSKKPIRRKNSLTCSRKCSKKYLRNRGLFRHLKV